jgi:hypothetical protein
MSDPTNGFVSYVSDSQAQSSGLYKVVNNQVYIGVDNATVLSANGPGRSSVRIQSNAAYTHGLYIADFAHIPATACGSWPALYVEASPLVLKLTNKTKLDEWTELAIQWRNRHHRGYQQPN